MEARMNRIPKAVCNKGFSEEAVKLAMTEGVDVTGPARRLSFSMKTVAKWGHAAKADKREAREQSPSP
jgi:transposase